MTVDTRWGTKMQLFSETGYNLTICQDGHVLGTQDDTNLHSHLSVTSAGSPGLVKIEGVESGLFLCFAPDGNLYGEVNIWFAPNKALANDVTAIQLVIQVKLPNSNN